MVISASKLLILLIISTCYVTAFCPDLNSCTCNDKPDGYYIDCKGPIDTNLSGIIQSLNRRQVQRLTVTNASWPILEELPSANIRSLQLISCGIKKITDATFTKLAHNLEHLTITENMLTTVTLPDYLPKLISLNLNYNQLTDLSDNALKGAESLRHLHLEGNKICSLSSNSLLNIKNILELLDLSDNCFNNIPAQNLRNCIRLMYLDLSHNTIKKIANFELMNLPLLKELRINNNQISYIAPMAFMNVPLLEHLYLRNNLISSIETERLFQVFKNLEVLDLSENMLTTIPSFKELFNLRQIHLNHNKISRIGTLAFSSNRKLQLINLQSNLITSMSRNSFDSLDELVVLNLANNAIKKIERVMLDGMRNLQQLSLRNNSLSVLENLTFTSVSQITTLDLSHNSIHKIEKNVRTFLPYQTEVLCAGPEKYTGVRLKELMIVKANETVGNARHTFYGNSRSNVGRDVSNILPSGFHDLFPNLTHTQPITEDFTDTISSIQNIPDINYLPKVDEEPAYDIQKFNNAIEQLSSPLFHATAGKLGPKNIKQFIEATPNLVVSVPGMGDIDISKLPPGIMAHVLRGGQIPGLSPETLNRIMKEYLKRMYAVAETTKWEKLLITEPSYRPPQAVITQEANISYLIDNKHKTYGSLKILELLYTTVDSEQCSDQLKAKKSKGLSSAIIEVMRMLPPGYNISKVPKPVIDALFRGEVPDFTLLPSELQQHLLKDGYRLIAALSTDANKSVEEILHNLPTFKRPIKPTFVPYDINEVSNNLIQTKQRAEKLVLVQYYTALLLGFVGAASIAVLGLICVYMKRKRLGNTEIDIDEDSLVYPSQMPQSQQLTTRKKEGNCASEERWKEGRKYGGARKRLVKCIHRRPCLRMRLSIEM
ncbi:Leucine-rich repeat-containing protein 15 [Dirofilaria immitis]|nr:Leucine-rich repeat-containing protein 15 [Dirofilaria immitis]